MHTHFKDAGPCTGHNVTRSSVPLKQFAWFTMATRWQPADFVGIGFAESIAVALEKRFLEIAAGNGHWFTAQPDPGLRRRAR
jgi:hypothetical protein